MPSLKSLIPSLAAALQLSPAALYERQRALVRAGLLQIKPGRGPGSGVPATASSVAMLLISVIATTSLSEVGEQTRIVANLKSADGPCPLTGEKTFAAALTAILKSADMRGVRWIDIERHGTHVRASIVYGKDERVKDKYSHFGKTSKRDENFNLRSLVSLFLAFAIDDAAIRLARQMNK
jgi:hypothetical protein